MAFVSFYYWMLPYWEFFAGDIQRKKVEAPLAMWDEIPRQLDRLTGTGYRLDVSAEGVALSNSQPKIREFFCGEVEECKHAVSLPQ